MTEGREHEAGTLPHPYFFCQFRGLFKGFDAKRGGRALYMHNHGDTYQIRPGFEFGASRLQAPVDKNEPFYLKLCYFKLRELEVPGT